MVTKLSIMVYVKSRKFESCVVLDGNQTGRAMRAWETQFESCVVLDGNQTERHGCKR